MSTTEPTDDQINEAIARWMGLKPATIDKGFRKSWLDLTGQDLGENCEYPRYTSDLNAVAEVEKKLSADDEGFYVAELASLIMDGAYEKEPRYWKSTLSSDMQIYRSTARQRAIAIVRTLNLLPI